jgi:hypothetical protein
MTASQKTPESSIVNLTSEKSTDMSDKEFLKAQEDAKFNRRLAGLLAAGEGIGDGIAGLGAGTKLDTEKSGVIKGLGETSDNPIKDLASKRKAEKEMLDLMDDKSKNDPNSEVSKLYRESFAKMGITIGPKATAADLEKAQPAIGQMMNRQMQMEATKALREQTAESREERKSSKQGELNDKYMSKFNDTINKFEKEKEEGNKHFDTAISLADQATKSPTAAINLARALIKSIEGAGARVSDKDIETTLRAGGVSDNAIAKLKQAQSGTIPAFQVEDVKNMLSTMKAISDKKFDERKEQMVYRQAKLLKTSPEAIKEATFMPSSSQPQQTQEKRPTPEQVATFSSMHKMDPKQAEALLIKRMNK